MSSNKLIKIETADKKEYDIPYEQGILSVTIKNIIDDLGDSENAIPLPNVVSNVFEKIIIYLKYIIDNPIAKEKSDESEEKDKTPETFVFNPWETEYLNIDQKDLFEIILAANFLDIKPLLNLTCRKVASIIKGKTPEEIRKAFNIKNDFTPEEEEKINKENEWCEDK